MNTYISTYTVGGKKGTWLRPEEATADMEKMREKRDMDWIQRQLLAQMVRWLPRRLHRLARPKIE